jgi:hypothetical protein
MIKIIESSRCFHYHGSGDPLLVYNLRAQADLRWIRDFLVVEELMAADSAKAKD